MGIKGIYKEIGSGKRVSLCKLAVDKLEETGRPLRVAIDISIWQFQVQAARGGANPAVRTLFYRLVRLLSLSIQPLFVFDGPNKPLFKRGKRSTGRPGDTVATATAKHMIRLFGFDYHTAPGEAEAECALLQRQGVVDAVLSEDVDTIMFGCTRTLRNWSAIDNANGTKSATTSSKPPTHVTVHDAAELENGLDREGMVLVALMSGGDYIPEGVPGCGVKVACEAARGGFGLSLCRLKRADAEGLVAWRDTLMRELRDNENKHFRTKHKALVIPESFPNMDVLRYYTHPVVSQAGNVERLREEFPSGRSVDVEGLRAFVRDTFDWSGRIGAVKFIRVIAPGLLVQKMLAAAKDQDIVNGISLRRSHVSTDSTPELRVAYTPVDIVGLDLDKEPEDVVEEVTYGRDGLALNSDDEFEEGEELPKPGAKNPFDPLKPDMVWIPESVVQLGAPLAIQEWQDKQRAKEQRLAAKAAAPRKRTVKKTGMPAGALDKYVKTTKNITISISPRASSPKRSVSPPHPILLSSLSQPAPRLSPNLARMSTKAPPASSQSQAKASTPTRSKRPPRKTKGGAAAAEPAEAQTNPWTIASSQKSSGSPSVSRVSKSAIAAPSKPESPPPRCRLPETIILESSPLVEVDATTSNSISKGATKTTNPEKKHGRRTPPPENSFQEDPFASSPTSSPRKHRSPIVASGRTQIKATSQPPPSMNLKKSSATSRSRTGAKKAPPVASAQQSIKAFGAVQKTASSISSQGLEKSNDDMRDPFASDDDEDFPALSEIGRPSSQPPGAMRRSNERKFNTNSSIDISSPNEAIKKPPDRSSSSDANASTKEGNGTSKNVTRETSKATTKLYYSRESNHRFVKEVEVTRDEADRIMSQQLGPEEDGPGRKGSAGRKGGAVWRLSDMSVIDLTGDD